MTVAVAPRVPHPDQDWDLVAVYAGLRGIERGDACVELGLAIKVKPPEPVSLDRQVAMARDIVRMARRHHEATEPRTAERAQAAKALKSAESLFAVLSVRKEWEEWLEAKKDSPPPPPKPEPPTPKPEPPKAKSEPLPPEPPSPPQKKLAWGQLRLVLRLVSSHGKGRRRRLRKRPDPEDVRRVLRLVQERFPYVDFCDHLRRAGFACRAFIATALSRHRPPWQPHDGEKRWDLVQVYMDIKGIKNRRAACVELGLHEALPRPEPDLSGYSEDYDTIEWPGSR
jgi:hypothetical protein